MINEITKMDAIQSLRPNAQLVTRGDVIEWMDDIQTQPTDTEIATEVTRLQAEYDSKQYARDRAEAYPSLADQADMQFHDAVDGTTTWQDAIQAVKDANPKP
jgi:hypothetical protein